MAMSSRDDREPGGRDERMIRPDPERRPRPRPRERLAAGRGLYLIVTRPAIPHLDLVAAAVDMSVPVVQLREKELGDDELTALASDLAELTRGSDTLFIVNDRPDVARAARADGVHVGTGDAAPEEARRLLGEMAIVGMSGNTVGEARAAVAAGADYLGIGPIFPTATKPDARPPIGVDGLAIVTAEMPDLPTVAVGGIDLTNVASVVGAGADYVAVVSAICHTDDPVAAMEVFLAELGGATSNEVIR